MKRIFSFTVLLLLIPISVAQAASTAPTISEYAAIAEGITLTNHRMISTYNEPIVEGTVIGNTITVQEIQ